MLPLVPKNVGWPKAVKVPAKVPWTNAKRAPPKSSTISVLSSASEGYIWPWNSRSLMPTPDMAVTRRAGAEDAGQGVQAVDGHVVQRPPAGLAPVPRGVDVAEDVRPAPHAFMFVVVLEGRPGRRPGKLAQGAVFDHLADALVGRADHLPRRGDQLDVRFGRRVDELRGLIRGRRHGLVEVDVLAGLDGGEALLEVQANRGAQGNSVDVRVSQQVRVVLIRALATPYLSAAAWARPGTGSQTAARVTRSWTSGRQRCWRAAWMPILPAPTTPIPRGAVMVLVSRTRLAWCALCMLARLDKRTFGGGRRMSCV